MTAVKNEDVSPRALREVWEWKNAVTEETKGMTTADALKMIHRKAEAISKEYGFLRTNVQPLKQMVAESASTYGKEAG